MSFRVSTKGNYGFRLMLDLAYFYEERLVTIKEISKRQNISEKYLEQIITMLNKGNLTESVRGAHGGYRLKLPPKDITVGMILRVLEGSLAPACCVCDETGGCEEMETCATVNVWKKMKQAVDQVVDAITLQEVLEDYKISQEWSCGCGNKGKIEK